MRGKIDGYMYLLTEGFEFTAHFILLRFREICHLRLDIVDDDVHGKTWTCRLDGCSTRNEPRALRNAGQRHFHYNLSPNSLRESMTWSIHDSIHNYLLMSRLCKRYR